MRAPLSTQSIFAYHIIDLPVALDSVQQHDVHRRVSLHLKQLAGYKFQTGSPPTEDPPFKFIFGNMEARLAILRLINVQALTNAAFFYHFHLQLVAAAGDELVATAGDGLPRAVPGDARAPVGAAGIKLDLVDDRWGWTGTCWVELDDLAPTASRLALGEKRSAEGGLRRPHSGRALCSVRRRRPRK